MMELKTTKNLDKRVRKKLKLKEERPS